MYIIYNIYSILYICSVEKDKLFKKIFSLCGNEYHEYDRPFVFGLGNSSTCRVHRNLTTLYTIKYMA